MTEGVTVVEVEVEAGVGKRCDVSVTRRQIKKARQEIRQLVTGDQSVFIIIIGDWPYYYIVHRWAHGGVIRCWYWSDYSAWVTKMPKCE